MKRRFDITQKGNSIIIVLLGILVLSLIGGAYYLGTQKSQVETTVIPVENIPSPTPDPNADWKTFSTSSFSLKYPSSWSAPTSTLQSTRTLYTFKSSNLTITEGFYYDQVHQRSQTYEEAISAEEKSAIGKQDIVVNGISTKKYIDKEGNSTTIQTVILKRANESILWISIPTTSEGDPSVYDQILSTFKFTDQTSSTSDWKTYTNNTYGIEFKYPNSLTLSNTTIDGQMVGIVVVSIPQDYYPNTNFSGATLGFGINKGASASDCKLYKSQAENIKFTSTKNINGVIFDAANTTQGAAGTSHYDYVYHYFKNNLCYEINSDVAIGNIDTYDPSIRPKEIKDSDVESLFDQIFATFKFN